MVLQAFDSLITDVNGLLRVDHDLMADCITAREASEEDSVRRRIIEYFRHREDADSYMELAHQYGAIGDSDNLSALLSRREVYTPISMTDRNLLIRSFNRLKSIVPKHLADLRVNVDLGDLPVICPLLVEGGCFAACIGIVPEDVSALGRDRYVVLNAVARSQYKLGLDGFVRARETYRNLIDEYTTEFPDDELGTVEFILKYAIACVSSGRVDDAISSYEHLMSLFQSRDIHNYYSSWVSGNLAGCYMRVGRVADSRPYYEYAVDVRRRLYGKRSPEVAWEYCYYWTYLVKTRQFVEALDVSGKALDIYVETYGEDSVECAWSLTNHAASLVYEGLYDDARREFSRSIELNDSVLPVEMRPHPYALTTYNNRALLDVLMGGGSEEELLEIFEYKNSRNGVGHPYNVNTCICLGSMTTDVEKSLHYYGMALEILDGGAFAGGPDSLFVELCMEVRKGSGEECLDGILSRYAPGCLENPDIRFLIGCIGGSRDESYPKVAVSHNNTSELLLFPLV